MKNLKKKFAIDKAGDKAKMIFMGERNKYTEAIILTVREQGENNRSVCMVSPDMGVFYATLYGGPKSKLRSLVQPFNSGTAFIYDDENRKLRKISDFDVKNYHSSLKENLYKLWAANLASEILLKTKCAGDDKNAYILLKAFLDGIDVGAEEVARIGTIRFLWRYLSLLGVQPDISECSGCGHLFFENQESTDSLGNLKKAYFNPAINGLLCGDCQTALAHPKPSNRIMFSISQEALRYLDAINNLTPGQVRRMPLGADSFDDLKRFTFYLIEQSVGSQLLSLKSGFGIF